jgi:hypothetical protein
MQSYVDFTLIPRNNAKSSLTCMDKRPALDKSGKMTEKLSIVFAIWDKNAIFVASKGEGCL